MAGTPKDDAITLVMLPYQRRAEGEVVKGALFAVRGAGSISSPT